MQSSALRYSVSLVAAAGVLIGALGAGSLDNFRVDRSISAFMAAPAEASEPVETSPAEASEGDSFHPEFRFSGYTVHYPTYQHLSPSVSPFDLDPDIFLLLSRLRLKPEVLLSADSRFTLEYEIYGLYESSPQPFALSQGRTRRQRFDLTWELASSDHYTLIHTIDRIYLRYGFSAGEIVVGRQRIDWGTGRIWNPTDLFHPINPADFSRIEKTGTDALSLKLYFGQFNDVNLVIQPQDKLDDTNAGLRFRTHAGEYDISLVGGYFDRRGIVGGDFAGNLGSAGVRGEGIVSFDTEGGDTDGGNASGGDATFGKWILGIDHQITPDLYGLLEYHFNGEGKSDKHKYEVLRLFRGEIINLGRQFLFVQASYKLHPLLDFAPFLNQSFTDGSGLVGFLLTYSATGNTSVDLGVQHAFGGRLSEFRYYPSSVYLSGTLNF